MHSLCHGLQTPAPTQTVMLQSAVAATMHSMKMAMLQRTLKMALLQSTHVETLLP